MKARKTKIVIVAVGILAVSFVLMRFLIAQKEEIPSRPPAIADRWVSVEPVKYTEIISPVMGKGRVISQAEVEIIAEASGKIESGQVALKKGQQFKKGQVLLTIYKDEAELALQSQKSSFLKTLANLLPDLKIDYPEHYDAYLDFFNKVNIEDELPTMPPAEDEKLKIFLASSNVLSDYYAILKAEKAFDRHTIYAPFNGSYTEVGLEVGAYTNTGGRIATAIKTDELEIEVPLESEHAMWVNVGDKVKISSPTHSGVWSGTVARVADYVQIETQSRPIFVKVPFKAQEKFYIGDFYSVEFKGAPIENCMEIPRKAVFNANEVFIVVDGRLKKRQIEVVKTNEKTIIFRGLPEGEYVVTQAMITAAENTPVKRLGIDAPDLANSKPNQN